MQHVVVIRQFVLGVQVLQPKLQLSLGQVEPSKQPQLNHPHPKQSQPVEHQQTPPLAQPLANQQQLNNLNVYTTDEAAAVVVENENHIMYKRSRS